MVDRRNIGTGEGRAKTSIAGEGGPPIALYRGAHGLQRYQSKDNNLGLDVSILGFEPISAYSGPPYLSGPRSLSLSLTVGKQEQLVTHDGWMCGK